MADQPAMVVQMREEARRVDIDIDLTLTVKWVIAATYAGCVVHAAYFFDGGLAATAEPFVGFGAFAAVGGPPALGEACGSGGAVPASLVRFSISALIATTKVLPDIDSAAW